MDLKYLLKEANYYKHLDGGLKRIGTKFLLAKTPLRHWVNTPSYDWLYSKVMKSKMDLKPSMLHIENTNICNAKCVMCPHSKMKRKPQTMSFNVFKKVINNIIPFLPIKYVTITGFGEPLVDKGIVQKIRWLNNTYPDVKVVLYTNASLLSYELSKKLLKLDIFKINFSVNGSSKTYKKIMGLNYEKSSENIRMFIAAKCSKKFPLTNISSMLIKDNEKDVDEFKEEWGKVVDSVMIYVPSDWAGSVDVVPTSPFKFKRWSCRLHVWKTVAVDVSGKNILCCRDYESELVLGDLKKQTIYEIRNTEKFKDIVSKHKKMDFSMPVCKTCDNCFDSSLDWWN